MCLEHFWIAKEYQATVFNAVHGGIGDDGTLQLLLEARGVPYTATTLFRMLKMLLKYIPEDRAAKKCRLKRAQAESDEKTIQAKKPIVVKYDLNHVYYLIGQVFLFLHSKNANGLIYFLDFT
ncbi:hypothetical protein L1987_87582 [Smallanthus sonchifolius]|nr:hypothetical protein L1987_87582 [Smallanthus sonchifolius]